MRESEAMHAKTTNWRLILGLIELSIIISIGL